MRVVSIILKELVQSFRDVKTLLIMIFMPTVLTLILGVTFKETFTNHIDLSGVKVEYILKCTDEEKKVFNEFVNIIEELNINIEKLDYEVDNGNDESDYVLENISDSNEKNEILIYVNSLDDIEIRYNNKLASQGSIINSLLDTFIDRYNAIGVSSRHLGDLINLNEAQNSDFVKVTSLSGKKLPTSIDYYGVVMITMTIMFSAVTGAYGIIKERNTNTLGKMLSMPISKEEILIGKAIGKLLIMIIQTAIVFFISKLIGVYWGDNISIILIILFSEGVLAISFGMGLGYFVKDNKSAWMMLLMIIMAVGFLGGAFIPLDIIGNGVVDTLSNLSPLAYINKSIFLIIYSGSNSLAINCIILNIVLALTLITFTSFIMEVKS